MQGSFEYAALHAEGAGDGGEDGDDEVDDGLDVLFFHCCGGFNGYTIMIYDPFGNSVETSSSGVLLIDT